MFGVFLHHYNASSAIASGILKIDQHLTIMYLPEYMANSWKLRCSESLALGAPWFSPLSTFSSPSGEPRASLITSTKLGSKQGAAVKVRSTQRMAARVMVLFVSPKRRAPTCGFNGGWLGANEMVRSINQRGSSRWQQDMQQKQGVKQENRKVAHSSWWITKAKHWSCTWDDDILTPLNLWTKQDN